MDQPPPPLSPADAAIERTLHWVLSFLQPNLASEDRRHRVIHLLDLLMPRERGTVGPYVTTYGSMPLKTYLPDGDIDVEVFGVDRPWFNALLDILNTIGTYNNLREKGYFLSNISAVHAEIQVIKCTVNNIAVDISINNLGGLRTLCFLEDVDRVIGRDHLFKQSILLLKAWSYYESRIHGSHHGLLSTYALETLILYVFNIRHHRLHTLFDVLYEFLDTFAHFPWSDFGVSITGPVRKEKLTHIVVNPEAPHHFDPSFVEPILGEGEAFLLDPDMIGSVARVARTPDQIDKPRPFLVKHINIIDPLRADNNIGRSVNLTSFYRIQSALKRGFQEVHRIREIVNSERVAYECIVRFFSQTLRRHVGQARPDVADAPLGLAAFRVQSRYHRSEDGKTKVDTALDDLMSYKPPSRVPSPAFPADSPFPPYGFFPIDEADPDHKDPAAAAAAAAAAARRSSQHSDDDVLDQLSVSSFAPSPLILAQTIEPSLSPPTSTERVSFVPPPAGAKAFYQGFAPNAQAKAKGSDTAWNALDLERMHASEVPPASSAAAPAPGGSRSAPSTPHFIPPFMSPPQGRVEGHKGPVTANMPAPIVDQINAYLSGPTSTLTHGDGVAPVALARSNSSIGSKRSQQETISPVVSGSSANGGAVAANTPGSVSRSAATMTEMPQRSFRDLDYRSDASVDDLEDGDDVDDAADNDDDDADSREHDFDDTDDATPVDPLSKSGFITPNLSITGISSPRHKGYRETGDGTPRGAASVTSSPLSTTLPMRLQQEQQQQQQQQQQQRVSPTPIVGPDEALGQAPHVAAPASATLPPIPVAGAPPAPVPVVRPLAGHPQAMFPFAPPNPLFGQYIQGDGFVVDPLTGLAENFKQHLDFASSVMAEFHAMPAGSRGKGQAGNKGAKRPAASQPARSAKPSAKQQGAAPSSSASSSVPVRKNDVSALPGDWDGSGRSAHSAGVVSPRQLPQDRSRPNSPPMASVPIMSSSVPSSPSHGGGSISRSQRQQRSRASDEGGQPTSRSMGGRGGPRRGSDSALTPASPPSRGGAGGGGAGGAGSQRKRQQASGNSRNSGNNRNSGSHQPPAPQRAFNALDTSEFPSLGASLKK